MPKLSLNKMVISNNNRK